MEMIRLSGQQGVPVIAVGDNIVVGFNRPRLEQLLAQRSASAAAPDGGPSLGLSVGDAAQVALRKPGLPTIGAYVGGVRPDSSAARAGIHTGDVITSVDGLPVHDASGLQALLGKLPPGREFTLQYQRDGVVRDARVAG